MRTILENELKNKSEILPKDSAIPNTHKYMVRISKKLLNDLCEAVCALEKPLCILQEYDEVRVNCFFINERARDLSISEIKKHCLRHHNRAVKMT